MQNTALSDFSHTHIPREEWQSIGMHFYIERERQGLTLEDVSSKLYIRKLYLSDIENGLLERLPGEIYLRGFLKSYARFLKLDETSIINQYLSSIKPLEEEVVVQKTKPAPKSMVFVSTILGSLFLLTLLIYPLKNKDNDSGEFDLSAIQLNEVGESKSNPESFIKENTKEVRTNNVPIAQEAAKYNKEESLKNNPITTGEAQQLIEQKQERKKDLLEATEQASTQQKTLANRLVISCHTPSWVHLSSENGDVFINQTLTPGTQVSFESSDPFILSTGNAGGFSVQLNDKELPPIGNSGEVKKSVKIGEKFNTVSDKN